MIEFLFVVFRLVKLHFFGRLATSRLLHLKRNDHRLTKVGHNFILVSFGGWSNRPKESGSLDYRKLYIQVRPQRGDRYPSAPQKTFNNKAMKKTILIHFSATGKVAFRSEVPWHMSKAEIRKECRKWCVPLKGLTVIYK